MGEQTASCQLNCQVPSKVLVHALRHQLLHTNNPLAQLVEHQIERGLSSTKQLANGLFLHLPDAAYYPNLNARGGSADNRSIFPTNETLQLELSQQEQKVP